MTERSGLRADCSRCFALCCVGPAFTRSSEFAIDKPAGVACPHLAVDHGCTIHDRLRPEGFAGCTAYDCFGAGQRLAQQTFGARDWRDHPEVAEPMLAALPVVRGLHELLWYLIEAARHPEAAALRAQLDDVAAEVERSASAGAAVVGDVDLQRLRIRSAPLLREVSRLVRSPYDGADHGDADLSGTDFRLTDLTGASLRGALLLGADLRAADLTRADLLGADLRGAHLEGARLRDALYLTRTQVGGALGDLRTTLPDDLERPAHWT